MRDRIPKIEDIPPAEVSREDFYAQVHADQREKEARIEYYRWLAEQKQPLVSPYLRGNP